MTFLHAENTTPNGTTAICSFNNSIVVLSIILNIKLYKKKKITAVILTWNKWNHT